MDQIQIEGDSTHKIGNIHPYDDTLFIDVLDSCEFEGGAYIEISGLNLNLGETFYHQLDSLPKIFPQNSNFELIVDKDTKR